MNRLQSPKFIRDLATWRSKQAAAMIGQVRLVFFISCFLSIYNHFITTIIRVAAEIDIPVLMYSSKSNIILHDVVMQNCTAFLTARTKTRPELNIAPEPEPVSEPPVQSGTGTRLCQY